MVASGLKVQCPCPHQGFCVAEIRNHPLSAIWHVLWALEGNVLLNSGVGQRPNCAGARVDHIHRSQRTCGGAFVLDRHPVAHGGIKRQAARRRQHRTKLLRDVVQTLLGVGEEGVVQWGVRSAGEEGGRGDGLLARSGSRGDVVGATGAGRHVRVLRKTDLLMVTVLHRKRPPPIARRDGPIAPSDLIAPVPRSLGESLGRFAWVLRFGFWDLKWMLDLCWQRTLAACVRMVRAKMNCCG